MGDVDQYQKGFSKRKMMMKSVSRRRGNDCGLGSVFGHLAAGARIALSIYHLLALYTLHVITNVMALRLRCWNFLNDFTQLFNDPLDIISE